MKNASVSNIQQWLNEGGQESAKFMRPIAPLHQNAVLRRYEWEEIDAAVVGVARTQLVAAGDLLRLGLVQRLGGLGTTISVYEQLSDMTAADVSMEGLVAGEEDQQEFSPQGVPVPIIHKDFSISLRHLEASRRLGDSLDVTMAETATRRVRDMVESMIFNGASKQLAGYTVSGFTTKSQRIQKTAAQCGGGDWATEGNPYKSVVGAIGFLNAAGFYGPFGVYVARTQYVESMHRLTDGSSLSELVAMQQGIPNVSFITGADALSAGSVVVFQLSRDVVDLAVAQDFTTVQWDMMGGMLSKFRVMTALAPRVKHDANDACGVLHMTSA